MDMLILLLKFDIYGIRNDLNYGVIFNDKL